MASAVKIRVSSVDHHCRFSGSTRRGCSASSNECALVGHVVLRNSSIVTRDRRAGAVAPFPDANRFAVSFIFDISNILRDSI